MKLEVGKYYRTRDGRKVGPIEGELKDWRHYKGSVGYYTDTGEAYNQQQDEDIIAEWTETPEVGTLKEIGAQVGDVVREANFPNKKVIAYHDGEPKPWVLECQETKEIDYWAGDYAGWRIISRSNQAQPSPVRTVTTTRMEIVPGRYNGIDVGAVNDDGIHIDLQWVRYSADELTAAIATLTSIRDAMQADTTA